MSQQDLLKRVVAVLDAQRIEYLVTGSISGWSSRVGGSSRQYVDALRVHEVYGVTLDREYLERWARELSVADLWHRMQAEAELL